MESDSPKQENTPETPFKKPMLVGKIGKFPKRFKNLKPDAAQVEEKQDIQEIITGKTCPFCNILNIWLL